jgi:hypothetical protein
MSRDYAAEIRAVVDAETGDGPYVSRVVAEQVVTKLRATNPDLLQGWLDSQAEHFIWQLIIDRDRSTRSHVRRTAKAVAFAADAEAAEAGDTNRLIRWMNVPYVTEDGSRKRLAVMRKNDLLFVADGYEAQARENKLHAAFMRAIARKVGNKEVGEVYTDRQLTTMWNSLTEN